MVADGRLYLSGQVGVDASGEYAGDGIEAQTRQAFENVESILAAVDRELADIAKITSYIVDIQRRYDAFHAVFREVFPTEPFPCHTALGVESLASETPVVELEAEVPVGEEQC